MHVEIRTVEKGSKDWESFLVEIGENPAVLNGDSIVIRVVPGECPEWRFTDEPDGWRDVDYAETPWGDFTW